MLGHEDVEISNTENIMCAKCHLLLEPAKITLTYMRSTFPTKLLRCPKCGQCYIPKELVFGKMTEVEETLEEK